MNIEAKERLSQIVKKARGSRSQRSFGKAIGVTYTTIQAWENGDYMPEAENLSRIAASAGMTLEELMNYIDGKTDSSVDPVDRIVEMIEVMPLPHIAKIAHAVGDRLANAAEGK